MRWKLGASDSTAMLLPWCHRDWMTSILIPVLNLINDDWHTYAPLCRPFRFPLPFIMLHTSPLCPTSPSWPSRDVIPVSFALTKPILLCRPTNSLSNFGSKSSHMRAATEGTPAYLWRSCRISSTTPRILCASVHSPSGLCQASPSSSHTSIPPGLSIVHH